MKFGREKCAMLIMKRGKRETTEEMKLPNQEKIITPGKKENYKYLGVLAQDRIKQTEMTEKITKEHTRRTRKLLETKFYSRNFIRDKYMGSLSYEILRTILKRDKERT